MSAHQNKAITNKQKQSQPKKKVVASGKTDAKRKVVQKRGRLPTHKSYVVVTPYDINPTNDFTIPIQTIMAPESLRAYLAAFASHILAAGFTQYGERSPDLSSLTIWRALDFMMKGIWSEVCGGAITLSTRPKIIHDLIAALRNKSVRAVGGRFEYSWDARVEPLPLVSFTTGYTRYWAVTPAGGEPAYNVTNFANYTSGGTQEDYSVLMKYLNTLSNPYFTEVESGSPVSGLRYDVSSRSRVYGYCGLNSTGATSLINSIENEVPIFRPIFAKFCKYMQDVEDSRIPTQLTQWNGDAATLFGLIGLGHYGRPGKAYVNRCTPTFVFVDFEEIYTVLCLWMVKAKEAASVSGGLNDLAFQSLPFSAQDFRAALMQALKAVLSTANFTQFSGPLQYNEGGNQFIPPTCGGNNYPNYAFASQFMAPSLIVENINSLKSRSVQVTGSDHVKVVVPVLGRWWQDQVAYFEFSTGGENTLPLFSADQNQEIINILDGTMGNVPVDLNNAYYSQVIADWNEHVEAVANMTVPTQPLMSDKGPAGLPLCLFTNSVRLGTGTGLATATVKHKLLADKYVTNYEPIKADKVVVGTSTKIGAHKKTDTNVTYVPAASISQLNCHTCLTLIPELDSEYVSLVSNLILPSIRFNGSEPGDVLNFQMYATANRMLNSLPVDPAQNLDTQSVYLKLVRLANMCVTGVAKEHVAIYEKIMSKLVDEGAATGILKTLAGIVGTIFPPLGVVGSLIPDGV